MCEFEKQICFMFFKHYSDFSVDYKGAQVEGRQLSGRLLQESKLEITVTQTRMKIVKIKRSRQMWNMFFRWNMFVGGSYDSNDDVEVKEIEESRIILDFSPEQLGRK